MIELYKVLFCAMAAILVVTELIAAVIGWRARRRQRRIKVVDLTNTRIQARPWSRTN